MKPLCASLLIISVCHVFVGAMYGGSYHGIKATPYNAQLRFFYEGGYTTYCSASIIAERWILSAAHCFRHEGIEQYQVRVGSSKTDEKGMLFNVSQIIINGEYDEEYGYESDIALVQTTEPIPFNEYQYPLPIAREPPQVGDVLTLSGYGAQHYGIDGVLLQVATAAVIASDECRKDIPIVSAKMFCTSVKHVDLCFGDSGGPAVLQGRLVGVASQGCEYTKPNVFTSVAKHYDWIVRTTGIKYSDDGGSGAKRDLPSFH